MSSSALTPIVATINSNFVDLIDNIGFNAAYSSNTLVLTLTGSDGNALSSANPGRVSFRDSANTGKYNVRTITNPLTLTINSGASLGVETGLKYRLYAGLLDVSGTPELCAWNPYDSRAKSLKRFDENQLQTSTALAATSVLPQVILSSTARPTVPFRYIGIAELTNSTGAWAGTINANYPLGAGSTKTGDRVGSVYSGTSSVINTTATVPYDATIPQLNEGAFWIACAYQAQSECNLLKIESSLNVNDVTAGHTALTIFSGNNFNAIISRTQVSPSNNGGNFITATYKDRANNTNNINYSGRFGTNAGVSINTNAWAGSQLWGNSYISYLEIEEIFA